MRVWIGILLLFLPYSLYASNKIFDYKGKIAKVILKRTGAVIFGKVIYYTTVKKTGRKIFDLDESFASVLNDSTFGRKLQEKFRQNDVLLTKYAEVTVEKEDLVWTIKEEVGRESSVFVVKRAGRVLEVYEAKEEIDELYLQVGKGKVVLKRDLIQSMKFYDPNDNTLEEERRKSSRRRLSTVFGIAPRKTASSSSKASGSGGSSSPSGQAGVSGASGGGVSKPKEVEIPEEVKIEIRRRARQLHRNRTKFRLQAYNALKRMAEKREYQPFLIKTLLPKLRHSFSRIRRMVCDILGMTKSKEVVPHLVPLLRDEDKFVRYSAAKALELITAERIAYPRPSNDLNHEITSEEERAIRAWNKWYAAYKKKLEEQKKREMEKKAAAAKNPEELLRQLQKMLKKNR